MLLFWSDEFGAGVLLLWQDIYSLLQIYFILMSYLFHICFIYVSYLFRICFILVPYLFHTCFIFDWDGNTAWLRDQYAVTFWELVSCFISGKLIWLYVSPPLDCFCQLCSFFSAKYFVKPVFDFIHCLVFYSMKCTIVHWKFSKYQMYTKNAILDGCSTVGWTLD